MNRERTPFIKICGMTTPVAVDTAQACEVDAIGFVFAASVRRVTAQRACELAQPARNRIACVAVTRHPTRADIDEILRDFKPDFLQTDIEDIDALNLPRSLSVLPVMRPPLDAACTLPGRVLFEGPVSGSGQITDWKVAAELAHAPMALEDCPRRRHLSKRWDRFPSEFTFSGTFLNRCGANHINLERRSGNR